MIPLHTSVLSPEFYLGNPTESNVDRQRQARKIDRIIELSGIGQLIPVDDSGVAGVDFLHSLEADEFIDLVTFINGTIRNIPRSYHGTATELQLIVESDGITVDDFMPAPGDKKLLLSELLDSTKKAHPMTVPALVGFGINAIHPFKDGNGRTARTLHTLLEKGYSTNSMDLQLALIDDSGDAPELGGSILSEITYNITKKRLGTHTVMRRGSEEILLPKTTVGVKTNARYLDIEPETLPNRPTDDIELLATKEILFKPHLRDMVAHLLLKQRIDTKGATKKENGKTVLLADEFIKNASEKDISRLYDALATVKREFVRSIFLEFSKPLEEQHIMGVDTLDDGVRVGPYSTILAGIACKLFRLP